MRWVVKLAQEKAEQKSWVGIGGDE